MTARILALAALASGLPAARAQADPAGGARLFVEVGAGAGVPEPAGRAYLNLIGDVRVGRGLGRSWTVALANQLRYGFAPRDAPTDHTRSLGGRIYREHLTAVARWTPNPGPGAQFHLRMGIGADLMYLDVDQVYECDGEPIPGSKGFKVGPAALLAPGITWPIGERGWLGAELALGFNAWLQEWYPLLNYLPFDIDLVVVAGWTIGGTGQSPRR